MTSPEVGASLSQGRPGRLVIGVTWLSQGQACSTWMLLGLPVSFRDYLPANTGLPSAWIAPQLLRMDASTAGGMGT